MAKDLASIVIEARCFASLNMTVFGWRGGLLVSRVITSIRCFTRDRQVPSGFGACAGMTIEDTA